MDGGAQGSSSTMCPSVEDGVCDEPVFCALGQDQVDCERVCEGGGGPLFTASCALYAQDPTLGRPPELTGSSSMGEGGRSGHITGHLMITSGEDPNRQVQRHFRAWVPPHYNPSRPTPLVLMLPGHRVAVDPLPDYTRLLTTADLNRFIVVFAEQEVRSRDLRWAWWTDWRWAERPDPTEHPDLQFLEQLVDHFKERYSIDESRVIVTGHSRGASMALIAALERPDLFSGAVIESGFTEFGYDERIRARSEAEIKVPLVFIHGVDDPDVCIDCRPGGQCTATRRQCGAVYGSDVLVELLRERGWTDEELLYDR